MDETIPLSAPDITEAEVQAVADVLRSGRLSLGPKLTEFEDAFRSRLGCKHAVACSSGTAALHLVLHALEIGPGDEVITTPFSFIASANCILFDGATPVFVDIDPDTWQIDATRIEAAITPRTCALIPVDVFGSLPDFEQIRSIARRHGLRVVEDSCEALGSSWRGRPAGTLGDAGVFGFYPNKQITTGEGGMIVTDDEALAELARSLRNQGRDRGAGWLQHARLGYNYRLADVNCAIGIEQMRRLDEIIQKRRRVYRWYAERLADEPRLRMQRIPDDVEHNPFVMVVRLSDDYTQADRDRILEQLRQRGIGCNNYFSPIHLQPFYRERFGFKPGDFPLTEALAARTIALPFFNALTEAQVERVVQTLRALL